MTTPQHPAESTALPYGTPDTPRLAVRGEAHLEAAPEIARITVTLTARDTDRTRLLTNLTGRNTATLDLIRAQGDAVEHLETGTLTVTPHLTKRGRADHVRHYQGHIHLTAELGDFDVLGELTTRLADQDLTRVEGPWWDLRPTSPLHREVRRRAVHDAVTRAREYAEALGTTVAHLVELADIGADAAAGADWRPTAAGGFRSAAFAGGAVKGADVPPLDLEPQRQYVNAAVHARFTLVPPRL
ncbi:SIMPL domain-containing protein [Streptomyces sp. NPDC059578]|uniref:SIMPL domain-containing protein n=1 Tax=unclassified Streptomyces TaxID=2593676 RepID=UPI003666FB56